MSLLLFLAPILTLTQGSYAKNGTASLRVTPLDSGYRQMYNLQFEEARQSFLLWKQSHPEDPLGPASEAATFLFSEFNRMGILQAEFFANDEAIKRRKKTAPDPICKRGFEQSLGESERLADAILARSPRDENALFAKVLNFGLRADYVGLIEKRYLASLGFMRGGRALAERLLAIDPTNYDAYVAIGVENYLLGSSPAPIRWLLQILGAQADKLRGMENVRLTAEKGHYLLPFARLLLAVAALRDKNRDTARELLQGLAQEFPNNKLFLEELAKLK